MVGSDQDLAICLVSGGMDSLVSAVIAQEAHRSLAFLHLNYGQKTELKELDCFHRIGDYLGISKDRRKVIDVAFFKEIGGSSLTDDDIPVSLYSEGATEIPSSYVPFRNTHIVSMAVSWGEVIGARSIYVGAVEEDSLGYPDCRRDYFKVLNELIKQGTKDGAIQVITPLIEMSKKEIVEKARELGAPLEMTWSCYRESRVACGTCDSCTLRLRGFQAAGMEDPLSYKKSI